MTDGGLRPDGTFAAWPVPDTARLTEAFRRTVLRRFVRLARFDHDQARGMRTWPHSGFHVHTAVWVSEDDRACANRLARYDARGAEPAEAETPPAIVRALRRAPTEATRRWATLLQQIVEVDPLACSRCHGVMRLVSCITPPSVIDQILAHRGAREPHAWPGVPHRRGHRRAAARYAPHARRPSRGRRSRRQFAECSTDPN